MKRRISALFFLFLFLHGLLGFSLTRHYCTHSGKELYALGDYADHPCLEITPTSSCCKKFNAPKPSCCEVEKTTEITCASYDSNTFSDNCCTDEASYFRITDSLIKNTVEWCVAVPINHLIPASSFGVFALKLILSQHFLSSFIQIPPLLATERQSMICVFRI